MSDLPLVSGDASIRDAVAVIDAHGHGIVLVIDENGRLLETVTDGDVRRAMLAGLDLEVPLARLIEAIAAVRPGPTGPITAPPGATAPELVKLMQDAVIRQVPLVDDHGRPVGLALLEELIGTSESSLRAMVMAGGFGRRLAPLTDDIPKPMLPVGDRPLLQRIVEQLRDAGIGHVKITTHYKATAISEYFGDGRDFGVEIEYVAEEQPLGTAGALGLVDIDGPLLVMNGDLLTAVDVKAMHRFHEDHGATMTVAVRPYEVTVPFGLVDIEGALITGFEEKPLVRGFVNAGLYLVNPEVRDLVPAGERLDMPELIVRLVREGARVVGFPLRESWIDVGRPDDYARANDAVAARPVDGSRSHPSSPRPVLAVIAARGGSKQLPGKALRPLAGLPLIVHSIEAARLCPDVGRIIVSTDSEEIAAVARAAGAEVPFLRPAELADDETPMWPVVRHALDMVDPDGSEFGSVLLLQASNPIRDPGDIGAAVDLLAGAEDADGVIAVSVPHHNPIWTARVEREGSLQPLISAGEAYARRQDVPRVVDVNGAVYLWRTDLVRGHPEDPASAARLLPLEIDGRLAIDIDTAFDLELAELLVREGLVRLPWLE